MDTMDTKPKKILVSFVSIVVASHPKNPEARLRDRRVVRRRQPERERAPGLGRIQNAVVPDARRGVIGRSLVLVFLEDRLADRPFFLPRERPALPPELVAVPGGQHPRPR